MVKIKTQSYRTRGRTVTYFENTESGRMEFAVLVSFDYRDPVEARCDLVAFKQRDTSAGVVIDVRNVPSVPNDPTKTAPRGWF